MQGVLARPIHRYASVWPVLNWGLFALGALLVVA